MGGLEVLEWCDMFNQCHERRADGTLSRVCWPDGGSYLTQPALVVSMFGLIAEVLAELNQ